MLEVMGSGQNIYRIYRIEFITQKYGKKTYSNIVIKKKKNKDT